MLIRKWSTSDSSLFKLCPRKFFYSKVLGYDLAQTPNYLKLGRAYDDLTAVYDARGKLAAWEAVEKLFMDEHERCEAYVLLKKFFEVNDADPLPPAELQGKPGNQVGFGIDVGNGLRFTGFLDKLSRTEDRGYVVVERKTTSDAIEENSEYWKKLPLDPQIRSYVWFLRQKGLTAGWVCYEVIRKLGSSYNKKLAKKKENTVEEYKNILNNLPYEKTLVARKWIYLDVNATDEWMIEQRILHSIAEETLQNFPVEEYMWIKHEQACDAYGGCPFRGVCAKEVSLEGCSELTKTKGRFDVSAS